MSSVDPTQTSGNAPEEDNTETSHGHESNRSTAGAVPESFGRYRIIRRIGEGGMGTVFEAEQERPRRTVALKVIRAGYATSRILKRFELEAHVLGRLQHPGIAQIYEAGTADTPAGTQPFFAMEYIRGVSLSEYVRQHNLPTSDCLKLVARICDAVHHAHQKGVIHRDLKPANILVDEAGQPKILDFGVARATDSDMQVTTQQTDVGQIIGTLKYMSPEQIAASPNDLDTRSDVYALGVIAYELLAGTAPYDLKQMMIHEAARVIREEEPTRLSAVNRSFRGDIETIVAKALEKDKTRRYQSAAELADDIHRYLHDEPIVARPPSTTYQLQKFAKRHKALAAGVCVAFAALAVGLAISTFLYVQAEQARQGEAAQRRLAEQRKDEAEAARNEAQTRADELKTVTEFQQSMLSEIDARQMGLGILAAERDSLRKQMEREGAATQDLEAALASFDALTEKINATNVALDVVDQHVLAQAAATIAEQFADKPQVRASLQQTVATTYRMIGLLQESMPLQQAALDTRRKELGEDHPDTLTSLNEMGNLLERMNRLTEAEPYFRKALEVRRRILGNDDPNTLISVNDLGLVLYALNRFEETLPLYREAVESSIRVLGEDNTNTLTAMNNLSILLDTLGMTDEADEYRRRVLDGQRRALGDDHPNTLIAVFNMGFHYQNRGEPEKALKYYKEALEAQRRVLGDDHQNTLMTMNSVAMMLNDLGRSGEAAVYFRSALEGRRRVLGMDHEDTLISFNNMGYFLNQTGQYRDAVTLLEEGEPAARRVWKERRPHLLAKYLGKLGYAHAALGEFARGENYLLETHGLASAYFGADDARLRMPIEQLVALYEGWDADEPGKGHGIKADNWRSKLSRIERSDGN